MGEFNGEISNIQITEEVISSIAAAAALNVEGTAGLEVDPDNGFNLWRLLFKKNSYNGVMVDMGKGEVSLSLNVLVYFGCKLNEIGNRLQKSVKDAVETMAGIKVRKVDINIVGIEKRKESLAEDETSTEYAFEAVDEPVL